MTTNSSKYEVDTLEESLKAHQILLDKATKAAAEAESDEEGDRAEYKISYYIKRIVEIKKEIAKAQQS